MAQDKFGDRMKSFEVVEAGRKAMPELPLLARLDGRAFHTFTKGMKRPYDSEMSEAMIATTSYLVEETHAELGYTQSDEISLLWIPGNPESSYLFDGKFQKLTSVLAGMASAKFMQLMLKSERFAILVEKMLPAFDCRVWQVPNLQTAVDVFAWREADATKNSITMAAQSVYSHKKLQGKNSKEKIEMLWDEGINWNDYPASFKRGTYIRRRNMIVTLTDAELAEIPEKFRPTGAVARSKVVKLDMPPVRKIKNQVEVLVHDLTPEMRDETNAQLAFTE